MRILVLHRIPDSFVHYADNIDHERHEVTYVSAPDRMATLPKQVRAQRISRPGTGDTAAEVLAAVSGHPAPDLVIALSEYDLLSAAEIRAALGVPGPKPEQVLPTRNKVVMKAAVAAAGLRIPRYAPLAAALADAGETAGWAGPTILKPLAGASSEGVREFPTLSAALAEVRRPGTEIDVDGYEVEEFVDGPIIHIDGLMADGAPTTILASRYVNTCLGYAEGQPLGSVQIDTGPDVVDWSVRCLRAVGIDDGPFHLEVIETTDGLVFLEVGARFGGADVVDSFHLATGVHLPSAQVRQLVGGSTARPVGRMPGPHERYGWFVFPGHLLGSAYCQVDGEKEFRDDPVVWRWVQRGVDEPVKAAITYADADVPLAGVLGPASSEHLEGFLTRMFATVRVEPLGTDQQLS